MLERSDAKERERTKEAKSQFWAVEVRKLRFFKFSCRSLYYRRKLVRLNGWSKIWWKLEIASGNEVISVEAVRCSWSTRFAPICWLAEKCDRAVGCEQLKGLSSLQWSWSRNFEVRNEARKAWGPLRTNIGIMTAYRSSWGSNVTVSEVCESRGASGRESRRNRKQRNVRN